MIRKLKLILLKSMVQYNIVYYKIQILKIVTPMILTYNIEGIRIHFTMNYDTHFNTN